MKRPRVAVLGAGIMGGSVAILLARCGIDVTLFDAAEAPFCGASRWNEGKIHLGFLYSADPSLRTAKRVLPGGLLFKPLLEDLIGCSIDSATTAHDDTFLCHSESIVPPDAMQTYFREVTRLASEHPDASRYLVDLSRCRTERLSAKQLNAMSGSPQIVAGFRIQERSVATTWVADRFVDALSGCAGILQRMRTRITAVRPVSTSDRDGPWSVEASHEVHGPYDYIINALWQGRMAVDATANLQPPGVWSNRYRLSVFLRTAEAVETPSVVIATGPFGDVKNYNNRDFYLSWYPKGLRVDSAEVEPPQPPVLGARSQEEVAHSILESLEALLPSTARIRHRIERMDLAGGWVFAAGQGALSNPASTLHHRNDFGVFRMGSYISVDTGKYSTAPWLAHRIVDSVVHGTKL